MKIINNDLLVSLLSLVFLIVIILIAICGIWAIRLSRTKLKKTQELYRRESFERKD